MKIENKDYTKLYSVILAFGLSVSLTGCFQSEQKTDDSETLTENLFKTISAFYGM